MADTTILDNGNSFTNYQFVDSKSDILIQLSDIMEGLFGKMTEYTNTHEEEKIMEDYSRLTPAQKNNIELLITKYRQNGQTQCWFSPQY